MASDVTFLGLGTMGLPMVFNLLGAGTKVTVWNRSTASLDTAARLGANVAIDVDAAVTASERIFLMLKNSSAIDTVLGRSSETFAARVKGRTVVNLGTTLPAYSQRLGEDIQMAGGRYVEAPVSGSRRPAEEGKLVAMIAGDAVAVEDVEPFLRPMASSILRCGHAPQATQLKLAVNVYLIGMMTALVEAAHFARASGLDLELFAKCSTSGRWPAWLLATNSKSYCRTIIRRTPRSRTCSITPASSSPPRKRLTSIFRYRRRRRSSTEAPPRVDCNRKIWWRLSMPFG